jgi:hypothetical protein
MLPYELEHLFELGCERLYAFLDLIELRIIIPVFVLNQRDLSLHDLNKRLCTLLDGEKLLFDTI